jgi:SagB-type dehydrogenase family enzyme
LRAPGIRKRQGAAPAAISARLSDHVALEARADGRILVNFDCYSIGLGTFSGEAGKRAQELRAGLPLAASGRGRGKSDEELELLVRRLARHGLLEYRLRRARTGEDLLVIEPQIADYWPRTPPLADADTLVLSRFAYLRRRGSDLVLESPRAGALFRICDPDIAAALAVLTTPQPVKRLRRRHGLAGLELLALLVDCRILFKVLGADGGLRPSEGDHDLVLWDFHDLLFHSRSTEGRHANPLGGTYPHAGAIAPLPAVRPSWPGNKIDLSKVAAAHSEAPSAAAKLLRARHSTRSFDDGEPVTLAELAQFLDGTARVLSSAESPIDVGGGGPVVGYTARPYPSAGASYELELYLAVNLCAGLDRGFYHYDAGAHALAPINGATPEVEALLVGAQLAIGAPAPPQILITIAARFGRMSWKYSSLAYRLILEDAGVLLQTFYLMATGMGLGGCAVGIANIDLFARLTGIALHVEGPVGQFALGAITRSRNPAAR